MDEPLPPPLTVPDRDLWDAQRRRNEHLRRNELERELHFAKHELDMRAQETNWEVERRLRFLGRYGAKNGPKYGPNGTGGLGAPTAAGADAEQWAGIAGIALVVPILFILLVGHISALLFDGAFPSYSFTDIPQILGDLASNLGDPGRGWDSVNNGGDPPGPLAFYGVFAALLVPVGFGARWAFENLTPKDGERQFATWRDVKHLRSGRRKDENQISLGLAGRRQIVVQDLHSLLVVGPAHSGKTSSVVIPALLEWNGPAVIAASKSQVIHETIGWRSQLGDVHVFDPAATTRYARSGWSPLTTCGTWSGAIRTARDLTLAAKASIGAEADTGDLTGIVHSDLWSSSMATALAPYLLAAASSGRTILHAAEWIEREEKEEVLEVLRGVDRDAVRAHNTTFVRNDPGRSSFFHVMYQILSVYKDPVAADSADRHEIVPRELLDGQPNTLYLTTPDYDQARFRPLCSTIVRQVLAAAYDKTTATGRSLDAPLLLLLDDAISVAPMNDLSRLASSASARGVQLVTVFQDFNQMEGEYGAQAGLVLKNHRVKLLLSGSQYIDAARNDRQLLRPKLGEQLHEGEGVLFYGTAPPVRLKLRKWFKEKELRHRSETSQDILPPPDPGRSRSAVDQRQALQVQAWMARHINPDDDTMEGPTGPLGRVDPTRSFADLLGTHEPDDNHLPENVTRLPNHRPKRQ
jgi:type IV secretion system protein VirD4